MRTTKVKSPDVALTTRRSALCLSLPNQVVTLGLAALMQCAAACGGAAQENAPIFAPICAAREITVLTLIEDHALVDDLAPIKLSNAYIDMLNARALCYAGRTTDAVAAYDEIAGGLGRLHIGRRE
jgi:hypothetical protein